MTAAYAVPADPKRDLQSIVFHNRDDRADFDVAAVTLNTGRATVIPKAVREPEPYRLAQVVRPEGVPPEPTPRNSQELVLTRDEEVVLDRSQGFAVRSLKHGWTPETTIALDPSSGLEVEVEGKLLTVRDFSLLQNAAVEEGTITLRGLIVVGESGATLPASCDSRLSCLKQRDRRVNMIYVKLREARVHRVGGPPAVPRRGVMPIREMQLGV